MFSGVVKIVDIDDYIVPSQSCSIKTIVNEKSNPISNKENNDFLQFGTSDLIKADKETSVAKIALNDCLACTGCITTAETFLIQHHSINQFIEVLKDSTKIVVISISPQSILSLSNHFKITEEKALFKLSKIFEDQGVQLLFNTNYATKLSLDYSYEEFIQRKNSNDYLISSECSGWICYAEKIIGEWIIPHLSQVKSPQQVMGYLLKWKLSTEKNIDIKKIYHITVMPCYDKKLESTRIEYKYDENNEVDLVLTTSEILELFTQLKIDFNSVNNEAEQRIYYDFEYFIKNMSTPSILEMKKSYNQLNDDELMPLVDFEENNSSNGYAEYILRRFLKEKFMVDYYNEEEMNKNNISISRKNMKNSDFREIILLKENKEELNLAVVNGLKNIKIITKLLEKGKNKYAYIEVMSCPSGCFNGGGQIKEIGKNPKETFICIDQNAKSNLLRNKRRRKLSRDEIFDDPEFGILRKKEIFEANFKAINKSISDLGNIKW